MKKITLASALFLLFSSPSISQTFKYDCGGNELVVSLSPNSARFNGERYDFYDGESDGRATKMVFSRYGNILKFIAEPMSNSYKMGLTKGSDFKSYNCTEV